jgi:hypothetical protein
VIREPARGQPVRHHTNDRRSNGAIDRESLGDRERNYPRCPTIASRRSNSVIGQIKSDNGCRQVRTRVHTRRDHLRTCELPARCQDPLSVKTGMSSAVVILDGGAATTTDGGRAEWHVKGPRATLPNVGGQ